MENAGKWMKISMDVDLNWIDDLGKWLQVLTMEDKYYSLNWIGLDTRQEETCPTFVNCIFEF